MKKKSKKGPSRLTAVGLSLICPGLGHLYLKQWGKALILFVITGISLWKVSAPVRMVWKIYTTAYPVLAKAMRNGTIPDLSINLEGWEKMIGDTFLWGGIFTVVFVWAVIDSYVWAKRLQKNSVKEDKEGE